MNLTLRSASFLLAALLAAGVLGRPAAAQDAKPATVPAAKPAPVKPAPAKAPAAAPTAAAAQAAPQDKSGQGKGAAACPAGTQCAKPGRARGAVPPPTTAEQMAALEPADSAQRSAAELVHYGKYVCDEKFEVFIEKNPVFEGYVDVRYKRDVWVMKPVASNTGAVRLEDTRGRVLLVQIPFKSMLLNTQTGQRIVDSCQHDVQRDAETQSRAEAQPAKQ